MSRLVALLALEIAAGCVAGTLLGVGIALSVLAFTDARCVSAHPSIITGKASRC